jgi:hypothetical protein
LLISQASSENHQLFSQTILKVGLSPYDDKRYFMMDKVSTLAHGHKDIIKLRKEDLEKSKKKKARRRK